MNEQGRRAVIFDFDGTIAETYQEVIKSIGEFSQKFGTRDVSPADIEKMRGMEMLQIVRYLGVPLWKIPQMNRAVRREMASHMAAVGLPEGIKEVLQEIKGNGTPLGIMTGNSEQNVVSFLKRNEIDFFDFLEAGVSIWGKPRALKKIMRQNNFDGAKTFYIGDEVRDIKAAHKAGIKIIAVTWGLNSKEFLEQNKPDYLISHPAEIVEIIKN